MSTIQKFTRAKGDVYRVLIRKAGAKPKGGQIKSYSGIFKL